MECPNRGILTVRLWSRQLSTGNRLVSVGDTVVSTNAAATGRRRRFVRQHFVEYARVTAPEDDVYQSTRDLENLIGNVSAQYASSAKCIIVPGIEYSSPGDDLHVITMGTERFYGARRHLLEILSEVRMDGGAAVLPHPSRRDAIAQITDGECAALDGIEIWNRKVDGLAPIQSYYQLARERFLAAVIAMDLHSWRQIVPIWNEITIDSNQPDGSSVAAALRSRAIKPVSLFSRLDRGLDRERSRTVGTLAVAESESSYSVKAAD
jgi:hypothetical protein